MKYFSSHWQKAIEVLLNEAGGLHKWLSYELGWCFLTAKGQRVKITHKIAIDELREVIAIMKSARTLRFDEHEQKIIHSYSTHFTHVPSRII